MAVTRTHGGTDAQGPARWDFSTCANAAGPCPQVLAALREADATRYPDPASTRVRQALATLHGVSAWRVLPAASASEFIQRVTAVTGRLWPGAVSVPRHAYGDYAAAASAWGRPPCPPADEPGASLRWHAEPSSPFGRADPPPARPGRMPTVLDAVYEPLRLEGASTWTRDDREAVFVLHSPNKALGLTGVRGAYAIAPAHAHAGADYDVTACCESLAAAAPSWPWSAFAEALLGRWATADVQDWVVHSRHTLAAWKLELQQRLRARGFELHDSATPFFVVRPPAPLDLAALKARDVAVRNAASFGLPSCWRVSAQPPEAQEALMRSLDAVMA